MPSSWVLVANEDSARIYVGLNFGHPMEIASFTRSKGLFSQTSLDSAQDEQVSGKLLQSDAANAESIEQFATALGSYLLEQQQVGSLQRLVVVAPRFFLNTLRGQAGSSIKRLIIREIALDGVSLSGIQLVTELNHSLEDSIETRQESDFVI
jgi:hypothetical protein